MTTLNPQLTVGQLVKDRPARSRVFESLGIDYCCGGKLPLEEACAKRGLDPRNVIKRLAAEDEDAGSPQNECVVADAMTLVQLADHIEQTHHAYLKQELPRLGFMVRKVAAVHGDAHPWMLEVDGVFSAFAAELESHMLKEEQMLFPMIRSLEAGKPGAEREMSIAAPIKVMEHEHDDAGNGLARMRELTSGFTPPAQACNTFRAMLDGLAQLEQDMHQHVHKENNVLFPKALAVEAQQSKATTP